MAPGLRLWLRLAFGLAGRFDVPGLEQTSGNLGGKLNQIEFVVA